MSSLHLQKVVLVLMMSFGVSSAYAASQSDLVVTLTKSKLTLSDGIAQATKSGGVATSAKFEFDDGGKLSLSIYVATKGLKVAPDENLLEEVSGGPEQSTWKPEVEVFSDAPHLARSSEQLTLLSLTQVTLLELIGKAQKKIPGMIFSITPEIKQQKSVAVILVAEKSKVTELTYSLTDGSLIETRSL